MTDTCLKPVEVEDLLEDDLLEGLSRRQGADPLFPHATREMTFGNAPASDRPFDLKFNYPIAYDLRRLRPRRPMPMPLVEPWQLTESFLYDLDSSTDVGIPGSSGDNAVWSGIHSMSEIQPGVFLGPHVQATQGPSPCPITPQARTQVHRCSPAAEVGGL